MTTFEIIEVEGKPVLREEATISQPTLLEAVTIYHPKEILDKKIDEYEEHIASLKTFPISGNLGEVGRKGLIEGKDFVLKENKKWHLETEEDYLEAVGEFQRELTQLPKLYAFPLPPSLGNEGEKETCIAFAHWLLKKRAGSFGIEIEWSLNGSEETYSTEELYEMFIKEQSDTTLSNQGDADGNKMPSLEELEAFGKVCFYKGFGKASKDDANCFTAWREEAPALIESLKSKQCQ